MFFCYSDETYLFSVSGRQSPPAELGQMTALLLAAWGTSLSTTSWPSDWTLKAWGWDMQIFPGSEDKPTARLCLEEVGGVEALT